jgi:HAD superfamily hydrolase (TIGR01509 family)
MHAARALLLDVDGTLVDSNDAHALSWSETLVAFGHDAPFDAVRRRIGEGGDKLLAEFAHVEAGSKRGRDMLEARARRFAELRADLRPMDDARALVVAFRERGLRVVVASSASEHELAPLLRIADVADLVDARTSGDDAARSKPDPDILLAAIAKSGCRPRACVMLGDTPYDVEAARRAGVRMIALRCGGWSDAELTGADAIYDDPHDLLVQIDRSPIA